METKTDEHIITVKIKGNIKIEDLNVPLFVYKDTSFNIYYNIHNIGGNSRYYTQLKLRNGEVISRQEGDISNRETISITHTYIFYDLEVIDLTIEVGYII